MSDGGWRLFVALLPSGDAISDLDAAVEPHRSAWATLRWTPSETWHLTGAFFGDVAEARVADLSTRLSRVAARHAALSLQFSGCGGFSRPARATVLYAGVSGALPQLRALADSCAAAGRRVGLAMEERAYRPHLTLARARGRATVDVRRLVAELDGYVGPTWTSSGIVLMRSHLGPPLRHEPIGAWPLSATEGHQA
jgi:2'-5' RNA ligase